MCFYFCLECKGVEPISMQMSGGHLLAAGLDGGNKAPQDFAAVEMQLPGRMDFRGLYFASFAV